MSQVVARPPLSHCLAGSCPGTRAGLMELERTPMGQNKDRSMSPTAPTAHTRTTTPGRGWAIAPKGPLVSSRWAVSSIPGCPAAGCQAGRISPWFCLPLNYQRYSTLQRIRCCVALRSMVPCKLKARLLYYAVSMGQLNNNSVDAVNEWPCHEYAMCMKSL